MSILIVGEKPSVSRAISAVVGASSAHKGYTEGMGWKRFIKQSDKQNDEKALPAVTEGQTFIVTASKGEHFTSPPKPYTEDTLLSAMERAGNEDYDEDTEKKGLGTPATRAATIEALVKNGYVERVGKQLRATDKGKELITVVPDEVKSAKLTAEWESKLQGESGVICFYLNGDDIENHKRVIEFMLNNNLIRKTKAGRFYNESFKFDNQTRAHEYGANFEGKLKLEDFIDLYTGEWIHE